MRVVEPEFAFIIGNDLPPRDVAYSQKEVLSAIESLHPALEIPDSRFVAFAEAGEAQLIADNACARHFVLGPAAPNNWREVELSRHPVEGSVTGAGGKSWSRLGSGAAVLGDPLIAMTWLANRLSALGHELEAGQVVTTGTCMPPLEVSVGDAVIAQYGKFGVVRVSLLE